MQTPLYEGILDKEVLAVGDLDNGTLGEDSLDNWTLGEDSLDNGTLGENSLDNGTLAVVADVSQADRLLPCRILFLVGFPTSILIIISTHRSEAAWWP